MAKKDKKNKKGKKGNKGAAEASNRIETKNQNYLVVSQMAKAVDGNKDGEWIAETLIGDLMIMLKTGTTGTQRKTYRIVGDKTNTRVTVLRQLLRDAEAGVKPGKEEKKDKKAGKKADKKAGKKEKAKETEVPPSDPTEFLKKEELEGKYKAKKAKKALSGSFDKKVVKKVVKQWGDAKKVSGTTIVRTLGTIVEDVTGEQVMEVFTAL